MTDGSARNGSLVVRLKDAHTDQTRTLGPFDFVQLTYTALRVGPDGDEVADNRDGRWVLLEDGSSWSDVVVEPAARSTSDWRDRLEHDEQMAVLLLLWQEWVRSQLEGVHPSLEQLFSVRVGMKDGTVREVYLVPAAESVLRSWAKTRPDLEAAGDLITQLKISFLDGDVVPRRLTSDGW